MKRFIAVATAIILVVCAVASLSACSADSRLPGGKYISANNPDVYIVVSGKKFEMTSSITGCIVTIKFTHEIIENSDSTKSISLTYSDVSYKGGTEAARKQADEWVKSMFSVDEPTVLDLITGDKYFTFLGITFYKQRH
jgi:hypothetical protein